MGHPLNNGTRDSFYFDIRQIFSTNILFFSLGVLHKSVSPDHRGREVQEGPQKGHIWSALPLRQR